jgi:hypothetical protein
MREFLHENHRHESEGNSSTTIDVFDVNRVGICDLRGSREHGTQYLDGDIARNFFMD